MPETREITVYKFDELSDRAKKKAVSDWAAKFDFDADSEIDYFKEEGVARGFDIEDVRYSISYSQGDGASWQGRVQLGKFIDYHLKDTTPEHARYIVLRELLRDGWLDDVVDVSYRGYSSVHSGIMFVDSIGFGSLWEVADNHDGEDSVIGCESVLQGASVADLAKGIDYQNLCDCLQDWIEAEVRSYADEIFAALQAQYEHETSYDYFVEIAEANEWRFDEDGDIV